jgi:hypothetical protein
MRRFRSISSIVVVFSCLAILFSCSSSSSSGTPAGQVKLSVMDAPGDFDHVYITIDKVRFHAKSDADPRASDWKAFTLTSPVTVDLLALANGTMQSIWDDIQLPVGRYQQIRLHLVPTYSANPPSGHRYFNEVVTNGTNTTPLNVPDADHGIMLTGTFDVSDSAPLRLGIDFDAGHDIVELHEGIDYVLKPRLNCYDLDHAGAIIGAISSSASITASRFVIKAERIDSDGTGTYHVVRRWTVPRSDGSFVLYPVSTSITNTWDIVIRGLDHKTVIIKKVPVTTGTSSANNPTDLGTIAMVASSPDYTVAGTITQPTGAWVQFYQTLKGQDEYPYEIRFRHFNPLWGGFARTFPLNNDQLMVGTYVSSGVLSALTSTAPAEGVGNYQAVAGAVLYSRSAPALVTTATTTVSFTTPLSVLSPYTGNTVTGMITLGTNGIMNSTMMGAMDTGLLFSVRGGMIVDAIRVDGQMGAGGAYTLSNIPGGTPGTPLHGAFYGIDAVGISSANSAHAAIGMPDIVDLSIGNDSANITMLPLW